MERMKRLYKILTLLLGVVVLVCVALAVYEYYDDTYGRWWLRDRGLSNDVVVHSYRDYTYRVYNQKMGKYTTSKIDWVTAAEKDDSLTVYAERGKRGFINARTGKIVIDAQMNDYRKAWVFSEGLAAVLKDGKLGFINAKNEMAIPFQYDYSTHCKMCDFGYLFHGGYCIMTNKEGYLGLIDTSGKWMIEPTYDEIWAPHNSGYRIVIKDSRCGVLDSKCNVVYPAVYEYVEIVSDGFVLTQEGRMWKVDKEGNIVHPFMFDSTYSLEYPKGYDEMGNIVFVLADYVKYTVLGRYGIMNRFTGKPITPAIYSDVNMLSKDLFEVRSLDDGGWYLVDVNGKLVSKSEVR
ncbi:MAG: WG repeat-containing protein [Bacteroidaceae bacterium]|nr:WG repeat-containing protein [Bacteroidaceae bacterium]